MHSNGILHAIQIGVEMWPLQKSWSDHMSTPKDLEWTCSNNATDPIWPNTGLFIWIGLFAQSTKVRQVGIGLEKQSNTHVLDWLIQSIIFQNSVSDWKTNPIHDTVLLVLAIMYQVWSSLTLFFVLLPELNPWPVRRGYIDWKVALDKHVVCQGAG